MSTFFVFTEYTAFLVKTARMNRSLVKDQRKIDITGIKGLLKRTGRVKF